MRFDAGALIFKIQTAGYQTFEQQMEGADRAVQGVGKSASEAAPKVEKTGTAVEQTGKKAQSAKPALDEQAKSTKKVGDESASAVPKQEKQKYTTEQQTAAAKQLAAGLTIAGVAVAALVGLSVAKFTEFDKAMSNTSAAVMATAQEQRELGEAALDAGADTAYSATEAVAAQEELAKAGQSVSQIVNGSLNGALALAAAGQLEVARSAEIMATTLTQFRLPAEEAAHVSDVLAAGAGKAQGSVDDLALALSYVGPIAGSVGFSLNETAGTIAYLATQGIIGEKAGTSLRGVLASLQAPSAAAAAEMEKYSISMFDGNGNMLSMAGIAEQLRTRLGGLTEQERLAALGRIFGNESLNAATLLYEGGAAEVDKWTAAVDDSGYAAEQAAMRQDNLAGDIEKLGGAFDTALIRSGSGANDTLRILVQGVTEMVDAFGEAPAPVQQTALVIGVATAAVLLFSGAAVGLRAKFIELKAQLDTTNASMGKTAVVGGAAGLALTGIITVVALLAAAQAEARAKAQSYADALESGGDAARELAQANLQVDKTLLWVNFGNAYDNAEKLGIGLNMVTDAASGNKKALSEVNAILEAATGGGEAAQEMADRLGISLFDLAQTGGTLKEQIEAETSAQERATKLREQATEATDENAGSVSSAADAYLDAANNAGDLNKKLSELIDTINAANGVGQDAVSANISYQDALRGVDDQIAKITAGTEGYAAGLDITTAAGAENKQMLVDLAADAQKAADAQYALDGNTDAYRATLEGSRQALIDRAEQLGANADEAAALADQIFRIPSQTEWEIIANTAAAGQDIDRFIQTNTGRSIRLRVTADGASSITLPNGMTGFSSANGNLVEAYKNGGIRENHVAQMARAGAMRVWAEPETGGESYVPHAPEKRVRSEQIMAETAAILGGVYIPAGAAMLADGAASPTSQSVGTGIRPGDRIVFEIEGMPLTAIAKRVVSDAGGRRR